MSSGSTTNERWARYTEKYLDNSYCNHTTVTILMRRKGDLLVDLGQLINGIFLIGLLTWSKNNIFEFFFKCQK